MTATAVIGEPANRPAESAWHKALREPPHPPPRQAPLAGTSAVAASVLAVSSADLARRSPAVHGAKAAPNAAYAAWTSSATALSAQVWVLNHS